MDRIADRIASLLDDALAGGLGSAAAVSVGDGGREVFRLVRGHTRRVPDLGQAIDENALFDLASVSKPMATVAIAMVLVGEKRLELDAPIRRWLPDAASEGTVRQLLGHSAGCIAHVEFFKRPELLAAFEAGSSRELLVAMAAREPAKPPGIEPVYSDLGFITLGAILERAAGMPLEKAFAEHVADPLGLGARYAPEPLAGAVATEVDVRGVVCGLVHDENCYYGGRICGHAGLFGTIGDVAAFGRAIVETAAGHAQGKLLPDVVNRFFSDRPVATSTWRLGWDAPSHTPGVSQAGDLWPRVGAVGHTGFTGTSLWLDLPHRRWVALLCNRVHPTRFGDTADRMKALRRAVGDAVVTALEPVA
jgi:CubicO group peptidase (beta-lactamase class C family)